MCLTLGVWMGGCGGDEVFFHMGDICVSSLVHESEIVCQLFVLFLRLSPLSNFIRHVSVDFY